MQEIEMRHLDVIAFQRRFTEFQVKFTDTINLFESLKELPKAVERAVPMLIHFQICEAFRKVIPEAFPNKMLDFEK